MSVGYIASTTAGSTSTVGTAVVAVPAGVSDGDVLIAAIYPHGSATTITAPGGWNLAETVTPTNSRLSVYWRIASSEPADYTWTFNANRRYAALMLAFDGNDLTTPVSDSEGAAPVAAVSSVVSPSVTGVTDGMLVVISSTSDSNVVTSSFPGSMTERVDVNFAGIIDGHISAATEAATAGATGTRTVTFSEDVNEGTAVSLMLAPVAGVTHEAAARFEAGLDLRGVAIAEHVAAARFDAGLALRAEAEVSGQIVHEAAARFVAGLDLRAEGHITRVAAARFEAGLLLRGEAMTDAVVHVAAARFVVGLDLRAAARAIHAAQVRFEVGTELRGAGHLTKVAAARFIVCLALRDGYVGPGSGPHVTGGRDILLDLREGDSFGVILPWAGIAGMSGLGRVLARTDHDAATIPDYELQFTRQPDSDLIPALGGGEPVRHRPVERGSATRSIVRERSARERGQRRRRDR